MDAEKLSQLTQKVIGDAAGAVGLLLAYICLLYTSPSPRDYAASRMPSSA